MELVRLDLVPDVCALPTAEQPLRVEEFDRLLAAAGGTVERISPEQLRITLPSTPEVAAETASLIVRETQCCSFFTFTLTATAGALDLDVTVPPSQTAVLDALATLNSSGPSATTPRPAARTR